jgi:aromatic-L-amino-acid decarboxylase
VALICARERSTPHVAPLVVYTSAHSHSSVEKAARLAGFGPQHVRTIAVDESGRMRADRLAETVASDRDQGLVPCAVVATVGTTVTTAVDPIDAISRAIGTEPIWLHVDAAMSGSAGILPEFRWIWAGLERADSLVVNPHKWLGASFDCSVYYVRNPGELTGVMSTAPSYLRTAADEDVQTLRDWGIPLGRRFRALKLWFLIREQGLSQLQARLRRDIENARWLAEQIAATPHWRVLMPVVLQTICVRHERLGLQGDALDRHTLEWVERINRSGEAYLTPATLDGRWMVRVSIGALGTERHHVQQLWAAMRDAAEGVNG